MELPGLSLFLVAVLSHCVWSYSESSGTIDCEDCTECVASNCLKNSTNCNEEETKNYCSASELIIIIVPFSLLVISLVINFILLVILIQRKSCGQMSPSSSRTMPPCKNNTAESCSMNNVFLKMGDLTTSDSESRKTSLPHTYESLKMHSWLDSPKDCLGALNEENDAALNCKGSNTESHTYAVLEANSELSPNKPVLAIASNEVLTKVCEENTSASSVQLPRAVRQSKAENSECQESLVDSSWYDRLQPKPK